MVGWPIIPIYLCSLRFTICLCSLRFTICLCSLRFTICLCSLRFTICLCSLRYTICLCSLRFTICLCSLRFIICLCSLRFTIYIWSLLSGLRFIQAVFTECAGNSGTHAHMWQIPKKQCLQIFWVCQSCSREYNSPWRTPMEKFWYRIQLFDHNSCFNYLAYVPLQYETLIGTYAIFTFSCFFLCIQGMSYHWTGI